MAEPGEEQGKAAEQEKPAEKPAGEVQPAGVKSTPDENSMAMLAHLLALFTGFVGPLIIWLMKKDESDLVNDQGKEALNFGISISICYSIAVVLTMTIVLAVIGIPLGLAVLIFAIVNIISAAMAANKGERFRYPLCIRLIK